MRFQTANAATVHANQRHPGSQLLPTNCTHAVSDVPGMLLWTAPGAEPQVQIIPSTSRVLCQGLPSTHSAHTEAAHTCTQADKETGRLGCACLLSMPRAPTQYTHTHSLNTPTLQLSLHALLLAAPRGSALARWDLIRHTDCLGPSALLPLETQRTETQQPRLATSAARPADCCRPAADRPCYGTTAVLSPARDLRCAPAPSHMLHTHVPAGQKQCLCARHGDRHSRQQPALKAHRSLHCSSSQRPSKEAAVKLRRCLVPDCRPFRYFQDCRGGDPAHMHSRDCPHTQYIVAEGRVPHARHVWRVLL